MTCTADLRQRLQNLSHQLRTLHGDAELIRAATRGVQTLEWHKEDGKEGREEIGKGGKQNRFI